MRAPLIAAVLLAGAGLAGCASPTSTSAAADTSTTTTSAAGSATSAAAGAAAGSAMAQTLAYAAAQAPDQVRGKAVAFLTACNSNPYCQAQTKGAQDTAAKYGLKLKLFDANFTPATELKNVQNAVTQGFDAYLFVPVADASGCANYKLLKATGKPVVTANSPMCGDPDYTAGTVGFVAMQTQSYFVQHLENAFSSCASRCQVLAVGGFVGSDLFTRWENALKIAQAKYPNAQVVVDQPGNFDPAVALQKTQDALQAHPDISVVVSSWDDMTRGVEQGVTAAGKQPGKDVRIYSVGATKEGVAKVQAGRWNETTVLLPYEETSYPVVQLVRKLATGQDTAGFTDLAGAPPVTDGPGSIFITAANAAKFHAEY